MNSDSANALALYFFCPKVARLFALPLNESCLFMDTAVTQNGLAQYARIVASIDCIHARVIQRPIGTCQKASPTLRTSVPWTGRNGKSSTQLLGMRRLSRKYIQGLPLLSYQANF